MNIQHEENGRKGVFYYEVEGERKALMTYSKAGEDRFIIDHTEVDESLQGQGVGYALVDASVRFAKENDLKILPLCPFAKAVFKKKKDNYKDVLA